MSQQAVSKAVRAGRIPTVKNKIDPAVADKIWAKNTRPRADMKLDGDPLASENGQDAAARERPQPPKTSAESDGLQRRGRRRRRARGDGG